MLAGFAVLDPKTYTSPSGEYTLFVDPTEPQGSGAAHYRLSRKGAVLWQGGRPFTLWDAAVTDRGIVGGYGYSAGLYGFGLKHVSGHRDYGDFAVVILDSRGRERLYRSVKRVGGRYEDQAPQPQANGVLIEGTQENLVVRVGDPDVNRCAEEWWVFALETGRLRRRFAPKEAMGPSAASLYVIAARAVAGTPLVLSHWWSFDGTPAGLGGRFTLIDLGQSSAKPVWILDLPHNYSVPDNDAAQDRLMDEIRTSGAILDATTPGQFTLRFVARKQRVTFKVSPEPSGRWRVAQIRHVPYVPPPAIDDAPRVPEIRLTLRDRLDLLAVGAGKAQPSNPVRRPDSLIAAGPGQLAFVRRNESPALVVVTTQGSVVHEVDLNGLRRSEPADAPLPLKIVWQGGTHFLVFCERATDNPLDSFTEAYRADAQTGAVSALAGFRCPPLQAVAAFPGNTAGFVVLARISVKYTEKSEVYAFDGDGRRTWGLTRDFGYAPNEGPEMLFSPESLTVLRDGSVAVLDVVRKSVQFYDRSGKYLWTLSLKAAWKREPSYPSGIVADSNGGFLVHDFDGTPQFVWMKGDGSVLRGFTPRYASGQTMNNPALCVAADGRLWAADDYSLFAIDASGIATTRMGDAPDAHRLATIAALAVQTGGRGGDRILAIDQRTRAIHVLDARGRRLHVCLRRGGAAEAPTEIERIGDPAIELGPNDTFCVGDDWFGADGSLRAKPAGFHSVRERAHSLRRRANGTWLGMTNDCVTSLNGALAILDSPNNLMIRNVSYLSLYSATNAPQRTLRLPRLLASMTGLAYSHDSIVLTGGGWAYCYRPTGQPLWRFALPLAPGTTRKDAEDSHWSPFLTDGGRTLWLFDSVRILYRYAMP